MSLKGDIAKVLSANFISLIASIVNGFIVPAFLSLDQYALLRTYTLYVSYIGILHFGFIDGLYIKYGGKGYKEIDKEKLKAENIFFLFFQLVITLLFFILGAISNDKIIIAFAFSILPINMRTFFAFFYQAVGEFDVYSKIRVLQPLITLATNTFLVFIIKRNNFWYFVLGQLAASFCIFLYLQIKFMRETITIRAPLKNVQAKDIFTVGIFIMLGNLSSMLFYSMDRWFVKLLLTMNDFAFYSFAVSMMQVVNILINSVAMVFYPHLARGYMEIYLTILKKYLLIIGVLASTSFFGFSFIIHWFVDKYIPSLNIIAVLFAGFGCVKNLL